MNILTNRERKTFCSNKRNSPLSQVGTNCKVNKEGHNINLARDMGRGRGRGGGVEYKLVCTSIKTWTHRREELKVLFCIKRKVAWMQYVV